jgi:hypothetical protein
MFDFKEKLSEVKSMIVNSVNIEFAPDIKTTNYLYINKENMSAEIRVKESCREDLMDYYEKAEYEFINRDDLAEDYVKGLGGVNILDVVDVTKHVIATDKDKPITLYDVLDYLTAGALDIVYDRNNKVIKFGLSHWSCITDTIGDYGVQINVDLHYKLQVFSELSNTDIFSKLENYGGDTAFTVMPYNDDGNITYRFTVYDVEDTFDIINDIVNSLI